MCPAPHKAATAAARHCFTGQFPPPRPRARRTPWVPPQGPGAHGRPQRGQTGPATARLHSGRAGERPPGIAGTEGRRVRGAGPRRAGRVGPRGTNGVREGEGAWGGQRARGRALTRTPARAGVLLLPPFAARAPPPIPALGGSRGPGQWRQRAGKGALPLAGGRGGARPERRARGGAGPGRSGERPLPPRARPGTGPRARQRYLSLRLPFERVVIAKQSNPTSPISSCVISAAKNSVKWPRGQGTAPPTPLIVTGEQLGLQLRLAACLHNRKDRTECRIKLASCLWSGCNC